MLALVGSPAAFSLPSKSGRNKNLAEDIVQIYHDIQKPEFKYEHFRPLVRHIIDKSSDIDIYAAVCRLVDTTNALTPPPSSIVPTFHGTPIKPSSSRLADSETREILERELFLEVKDCVYRDVGGFFEKHFNPKSWSKKARQMLKSVMTAHNGKKWKDFPPDPWEKPVWEWLDSLEKKVLADAPHKLHTTRHANQFKERKGQMDVFVQKQAKKKGLFTYKDVLVVGEQKKSTDGFKPSLLQLTRHARSVFADQPTRRFVHGFTLRATKMELWVFDRSGLYSSGEFDIHAESEKFAQALVGYATMDDEAMGLDTFIERKNSRRYVTAKDADGKETRIELKELLVRQRAVVCRGTTCYRTAQDHVAKISWPSAKRVVEVKHLKLAAERGVEGVARLEAYRQITSIADLRKGLTFPKPYKFKGAQAGTGPFNPLESRESQAANLQSSISDVSETRKRKSSDEDGTSLKRSRSSNRISKLRLQYDQSQSSERPKPSLYTSNPDDPFEDRIYSCLVISPAGRVISDFRSISELLGTLRDAIRAHQSLYVKGNILHRDISSNNIIITDPKTTHGFRGILIDLDLAKVRDSGPSGARHQTGTMQFMAIEVLKMIDHTYRHDLESFFYVLIWMCARCSWYNGISRQGEEPPAHSRLRRWEIGSLSDIADSKMFHMYAYGLEDIMEEFPGVFDVVKPLCRKIRKILFPLEDEMLNIGTPTGDPGRLYSDILAAYDDTISEL